MGNLEILKAIEDKIAAILQPLSDLEADVLYVTLYNLGHRTEGIRQRIEKALRALAIDQG